MLSQRGKPLLVHDGHSFGIQYIRKDKKYWYVLVFWLVRIFLFFQNQDLQFFFEFSRILINFFISLYSTGNVIYLENSIAKLA